MKKHLTTLFTLLLIFSLCLFTTSCLVADKAEDDKPSSVEVASTQEFFDSIIDGAEIVLTADLEFEDLLIPENTNFTVDLGGHTLSLGLKQEGRHHYLDNYGDLTLKGEGVINARGVQNFGTLTVEEGVTIVAVDQNGGAAIWNEGELTINGGTFKALYAGSAEDTSGPGCLNNANGSATVNGGTFISNNARVYAIISSSNIVINDAVVVGVHGALGAHDGKVEVLGGTFTASNYYALYVSGDTEAYVYNGLLCGGLNDVRAIGNAYAFIGRNVTLGKNSTYGNVETELLVSSAEELVSAIADKNYVVLGSDLTVDHVVIPENVTLTIDLNGHDITTTLEREGRHYYFENQGNLTLKGEGVITARGVKNSGTMVVDEITVNAIDQDGGGALWNLNDLTVNGGTYNALHVGSSSDEFGPGALVNKGTAVVNGGTFNSNNLRTYAILSEGVSLTIHNAVVNGAHGAVAVKIGTAVINGGTFTATVHYGLYAEGTTTTTVNGGTFTGGQYEIDVYSDDRAVITLSQEAVLTHDATAGRGTIIVEE